MRAPEVGGGTLDPVRTCTGKRPSAAARGRPSAVTRPGERAGQHHDRGVGRLRGQQLPPPDLQLRKGGTGLSAPCRPPRRGPPSPLEAARAFVAASNSTPRADVRAASREAHGRGGRGGSRKVREGEREGVGRDSRLILIKLEDLFAKMLKNTWRRVGARGAGKADVRGGPTCLKKPDFAPFCCFRLFDSPLRFVERGFSQCLQSLKSKST